MRGSHDKQGATGSGGLAMERGREAWEADRDRQDREYWEGLGDLLGLELAQWTYRYRGSFVDPDHRRGNYLDFTGRMAEKIFAAIEDQRAMGGES